MGYSGDRLLRDNGKLRRIFGVRSGIVEVFPSSELFRELWLGNDHLAGPNLLLYLLLYERSCLYQSVALQWVA